LIVILPEDLAMSDLVEAANNNDKFADLYRSGDTIVDLTFKQIVHHTYKRAKKHGDTELMKRIEENWEDVHGVPYFEADPMPVGLLGGPGQGKTAVMVVAAKKAAALMGLNFVSERNVIPTKDDFFFDVVTLGGQLSPALIKGHQLPDKKTFYTADGKAVEEPVLSAILPSNVTASKYARASFILLDDAPNAHPDILNAVYDLLKPENESEFSDIFYSYTGNTGEDGAAAKKFNTAIASRVRLMYMKDLPQDFIRRMEEDYRDDIAETYIRSIVMGFIMQNGNLLNTPPIRAQQEKTQFACSRTWTQFTKQLSQFLKPYVWTMKNKPHLVTESHTGELLQEIEKLAVDNLGRDVAKKLQGHALRVMQDADPISRAILDSGKVTPDLEQRIKAQYGNGESPSDADFMYAMADSLSNHAAEQYVNAFKENDEEKMDHVLKGLVAGLFDTIRSPKTPEYVRHVYQRFFTACVSKSNDNPAFGYRTNKGVMLIGNAFFAKVVEASKQNPVAITEFDNGRGQKARLVDEVKNVSSIKAAFDGEIDAVAAQAKAYKDAMDRHKPKPKDPAAASTQPAAQAKAHQDAMNRHNPKPKEPAAASTQPAPQAKAHQGSMNHNQDRIQDPALLRSKKRNESLNALMDLMEGLIDDAKKVDDLPDLSTKPEDTPEPPKSEPPLRPSF
jgi:hypothetical protein